MPKERGEVKGLVIHKPPEEISRTKISDGEDSLNKGKQCQERIPDLNMKYKPIKLGGQALENKNRSVAKRQRYVFFGVGSE